MRNKATKKKSDGSSNISFMFALAFILRHLRKKRNILLFVVLLANIPLGLFGQYYNLGQDPAKIHWSQLKSKNFRIIYPGGSEADSRKLSFLLESCYTAVGQGLDHAPRPTHVILHPYSVMSNGVVSWAPKRMEFYPCPPQGTYAQDWLEQLALHEFRHVVQISKMNQGFTRGLNILLGEQASSLILGLFVPSWFMEGDAVAAETALSFSGRGSYPIFETQLRAQLVETGKYSYDKAVFGSFKDDVPGRYVLGYHLVSYGRVTYGQKLWQNALDKTARKPFMITPFSRGIKEVSGLTKDGFYNKAILALDSLWTKLDNENSLDPIHKIQPAHPLPDSNYHFPAVMPDGSIFSFRSGMNDIPRFVSFMPGGKEKILFTPGSLGYDAVCYQSGKILWTEEIPDLRWQNRSYSVIKIRDLVHEKTKKIGRHSRYFAAKPSADFSKIVVSECTVEGRNSIVILDAMSGKEIHRISGAHNELFITPVFDKEGKRVLAIAQAKEGKSIVEIDISSGKLKQLTSPSYIEISGPVYDNHRVIFVGSYTGIDGIYALDTTSSVISELISTRFGLKDITILEEDSLIFSISQREGHRPALAKAGPGRPFPATKHFIYSTKLDSSLRTLEKPVQFNDNILLDSTLSLKPEPYNKLLHLFNFHSWAPAYVDAGNQQIYPGIQLLSQNMLSTSILSLGWEYNRAEETGRYKAKYTYLGLYPAIDVIFEYGLRAFEVAEADGLHRYTYNDTELELRISQPLNFTRNKYYRFVEPYVGFISEFVSHSTNSPEALFEGIIPELDLGFTAYNILRFTEKDIFPRWGQTLQFQTKQSIWGDYQRGAIYAATLSTYFPGITRHHGLRLKLALQKDDSGQAYSDMIRLARGYEDYSYSETFVASADYALPLYYPDLSLPNIAYIKRLRADIFTDYSWQSLFADPQNYLSSGLELMADLHLFRFYAPIALGVRSTYIYHSGQWQYEFLWGIGLGSYGGKEELRKFEP